MSWTYTGALTTTLDKVRFLAGDTTSTMDWTLSDEEITFAVAQYPDSIYLAAALCADAIVGKLRASVGTTRIGPLSVSVSDSALQEFTQTAQRLRTLGTLNSVTPFMGGISQSDKDTRNADTDRVVPAHRIDAMRRDETDADDDEDE